MCPTYPHMCHIRPTFARRISREHASKCKRVEAPAEQDKALLEEAPGEASFEALRGSCLTEKPEELPENPVANDGAVLRQFWVALRCSGSFCWGTWFSNSSVPASLEILADSTAEL